MSRAAATCAVPSCHVTVERGMLMCKSHWFSLPKPLRDDVWRTWRAVQANRRGTLTAEQQLARIAAYRDAVRAAQDYLATVPKTPARLAWTVARDAQGNPVIFEQGRLL